MPDFHNSQATAVGAVAAVVVAGSSWCLVFRSPIRFLPRQFQRTRTRVDA